MAHSKEGYTVMIMDNFTGSTADLQVDSQGACEVLEAVALAMIAMTFHPKTVQRAMKEVAKDFFKENF